HVLHVESVAPMRSVELLTMDGKAVKKTKGDSYTLSLSLDQVKPGMYLLRVQTDGLVITEKIIKK
ncbi:MAG: T9SS type A sorting domain-containing protein, partial [Verrucomicrobia bacterium]|nr:T9SS type A sorting domain-containing protein [Prolixibacteraceae bacterium]